MLFSSRLWCAAVVCLGLAWAGQSVAADQSATVQQRFESLFEGVPVDGVERTPYGLYEVQVGGELLYTDENVSYILQGVLIDTATRTNVTSERQEALSAVPFEELPLELAFVQKRGTGVRRMAVFEDPNCGYCKQMRHTLRELEDVTIYTFMYPILSPDSAEKVQAIWCADDKAATWDAWMLNGKEPAAASCKAPVAELVALGQRLNVRGTPTTIFEDGSRVSGALPRAAIEARLTQAEAL
nr:DsbC family protein [Pseudomonas sp.]